MNTEKITFPGAFETPLAARLDSPQGEIKAYALFVHCFTCSKDILAASHISSALTEKGIAVLRFDFTGLGSSEGEFSNTNFSSNVEDIKAAIEFLRSQGKTPQILIGHSLGGAAILRVAQSVPELKALVTINAPSDPTHLRHALKSSLQEIESQGYANVMIGGREFRIQKQFIDDLEKHKSLDYLKNIHAAFLVFHTPQDKIVDIENAKFIFTAARHPKSFISLYEADHLLTRPVDAIYVSDILNSWVERYLLGEKASPTTKKEENKVVVTETSEGKFIQLIQTGKHTFIADEPLDVGGNDKGPGPYDLVLASLGACTSMTLRMYADRKDIPLKGIRVTLTHQKVYNEDLSNCIDKNERLDLIHRSIALEGVLTAEQKEKLLQIAEKCPIHKTLTQSSVIKTMLEEV
ncbi:MAG: alpha/beta fold hydrolase [Proteobacteria bacterium]|nr:alpha/beta fold hydrolase [Pseudomonadota bacterium]